MSTNGFDINIPQPDGSHWITEIAGNAPLVIPSAPAGYPYTPAEGNTAEQKFDDKIWHWSYNGGAWTLVYEEDVFIADDALTAENLEYDCIVSSNLPADYLTVSAAIAAGHRYILMKGIVNEVDCTFPNGIIYLRNNAVWIIDGVISYPVTGLASDKWTIEGGIIEANPQIANGFTFNNGKIANTFINVKIISNSNTDNLPVFNSIKYDGQNLTGFNSFISRFINCVFSWNYTTGTPTFTMGSVGSYLVTSSGNSCISKSGSNNTFINFDNTTWYGTGNIVPNATTKVYPVTFVSCNGLRIDGVCNCMLYSCRDIRISTSANMYFFVPNSGKVETSSNIIRTFGQSGNILPGVPSATQINTIVFDTTTTPDIDKYRSVPIIDGLVTSQSVSLGATANSGIFVRNVTAYRIVNTGAVKYILENCHLQTLIIDGAGSEVINCSVKNATANGTITVAATATNTLVSNCTTQATIVNSGTGTTLNNNVVHV